MALLNNREEGVDAIVPIPSIREFYEGKTVFITGANGFVGRFLVWKLLVSCDVHRIYILLRGKRGQTYEKRYEEFRNHEIFTHLPQNELLDKVIPIEGDITVPGLGLKPEDERLLVKQADVVFHAAASILLNQPLKTSTINQLYGTQNVLKLCQRMKSPKSLVQISSIACWFSRTSLAEEIYPNQTLIDQKPSEFINEVQLMSDSEADKFTARLVGQWPKYPNSYTFTKTLAEVLLKQDNVTNLPIGIVRSPLLFSTLKEPEEGWVDFPQTGTAMFSLYANGLLRTVNMDPNYDFSHLPLDMCINALITVAWYMGVGLSSEPCKVFNMGCDRDNPITVKEVSAIASELGSTVPSIKQLRPPKGIISKKPNLYYYKIHSFFTYTSFSHLVDIVLILMGRKPMLVKLISKTTAGVTQIERVLREKVDIVVDNLNWIYSPKGPLDEEERQLFYYNVHEIDWKRLFSAHHMRFRRKILREPDSNIVMAVRRMKRVSQSYFWFKAIIWTSTVGLAVFAAVTTRNWVA